MTKNSSRGPRLPRGEASDYVGYKSKAALERRAWLNQPPAYHIDNGKAYYYVTDLDEFDKGRQTF